MITRDAELIPRNAGLQIIRASLEGDPVPALRAYPGPRLSVITPGGDTPNDLHRLVPELDHEEMAGTSHWMQLDRPGEFNRILDRFLHGIGGSA